MKNRYEGIKLGVSSYANFKDLAIKNGTRRNAKIQFSIAEEGKSSVTSLASTWVALNLDVHRHVHTMQRSHVLTAWIRTKQKQVNIQLPHQNHPHKVIIKENRAKLFNKKWVLSTDIEYYSIFVILSHLRLSVCVRITDWRLIQILFQSKDIHAFSVLMSAKQSIVYSPLTDCNQSHFWCKFWLHSLDMNLFGWF